MPQRIDIIFRYSIVIFRCSIVILLASLIGYQLSFAVRYGISKGTLVREHHYTEQELSVKCNWIHVNPEIKDLIQPSVPECVNFGDSSRWLSYNETISCYHEYFNDLYFCKYEPIEVKHACFYFRNDEDYLEVIHIKEIMSGYDSLVNNRNVSQTHVKLQRPYSVTLSITSAQINQSFEQIKKARYPFDFSEFVHLASSDRSEDQFRKLALDSQFRYCGLIRFDYWLCMLCLTIILTMVVKSI
jgi:hypothetical protein